MADIRDYFKAYRKKLGLTLTEFGNRYGVSSSAVWIWENKGIKNHSLLGVQIGDKFGRLTVIGDSGKRTKQGKVIFDCECDCGNHIQVSSPSIYQGATKSCGCLSIETNRSKIPKARSALTRDGGTTINNLFQKKSKANTSGITGVSYRKANGRWEANIRFERKLIYLGSYETKEEASQARRDGELKYFAPILHKHGIGLKPQEIDEDLMKDDTYKRRPFYDFGKGID